MSRIKTGLLLSISLIMSSMSANLLAQATDKQWDCLQSHATGLWSCVAEDTQHYQPSINSTNKAVPYSDDENTSSHRKLSKTSVAGPINTAKQSACNQRQTRPPFKQSSTGEQPIQINADEVSGNPEQVYYLKGNIKINWNDKQLRAQQAQYQIPETTIKIDGELHYQDSEIQLDGYDGEMNTSTRQGEIQAVTYQLRQTAGRGSADTLHLTGPGKTTLDQASYTTCEAGDNHWLLKASEVKIDQIKGEGHARNVYIEFMDIPFIYTPYISFPVGDQRKSGFLTPSLGSSSQTGADIKIPYYWNIAANRDATITPRLLGKRGVQLQGELRYLNTKNSGTLAIEYLPNDSISRENRSLFSWQHRGRIGARISTLAELHNVSDELYFEDLGSTLDTTSSKTYLEQTLAATLYGDNWALTGRLQNHQNLNQNITAANEAYQRLPQITFATQGLRTGTGLKYQLQADLTYFYKHDQLSGNRLLLKPSIQYPLRGTYWFIKPVAKLHSSHYQLNNTTPGDADSLQFNIPTLSIDSGLFLERNLEIQQQTFTHTIEPRIFYVRTPRHNQTQAPIFDSALLGTNLHQLFASNRFSGNDRIADANQITLALGSRLLHNTTGQQLVHLNIGQILYLEDREVTLPGRAIETRKHSSIISELDARLSSNWRLDSTLYWNPDDGQTEQGDVRIQYTPGERRLFNLAYRFNDPQIEQIDTSIVWPISANWHAIASWDYSLRDKHLTEGLVGLEYDSCCWGLQLFLRNYINGSDGENDTSFYLQLELKGLGNIGKSMKSLLDQSIRDYQ